MDVDTDSSTCLTLGQGPARSTDSNMIDIDTTKKPHGDDPAPTQKYGDDTTNAPCLPLVQQELSLRTEQLRERESADVGAFPTEIWQSIFSLLKFKDRVALRLTCHGLAAIGAEFMVSRITFHTSLASLERLKHIADHELMRKNVTTLVYEAGLLADPGRVDSHVCACHGRPAPPRSPDEAKPSDRAMRLYERNRKKYDNEQEEKYEAFRQLYRKQQDFIREHMPEFFDVVSQFPNLQEVRVSTDGRCQHILSRRFIEEFSYDRTVLLGTDLATRWQLAFMLPRNLQKLMVSTVSVNSFDGSIQLTDAFQSLQHITLSLRAHTIESEEVSDNESNQYQILEKGVLSNALGVAKNLRQLSVDFMSPRHEVTKAKLEDLVGSHAWCKLTHVDFGWVETTEDVFFDFLKRQPNLRDLSLRFFSLTQGNWIDTTQRLRQDFKGLEEFLTYGVFEDENELYNAELLHRESWMEGDRLDMRMALDIYVTDHDATEYDIDLDHEINLNGGHVSFAFNPLIYIDDEYDEEEELEMEFGSIIGDSSDGELSTTTDIHDLLDEPDSLADYEADYMDTEED